MLEEELSIVSAGALKAALRKLEREPEAGKPLTGELRGCRSIRVEAENRLVYRLHGSMVEVLAIGRRRDSEAYNTAMGRI